MPLYDVTAQNTALDAMYGDSRGATRPASFDVGLLTSDPRISGLVEEMPTDGTKAATHWAIFSGGVLHDFGPLDEDVTFSGYARLTARPNDNTFWDAAAEGSKSSKVQTFAGGPAIILTVRFNEGLI